MLPVATPAIAGRRDAISMETPPAGRPENPKSNKERPSKHIEIARDLARAKGLILGESGVAARLISIDSAIGQVREPEVAVALRREVKRIEHLVSEVALALGIAVVQIEDIDDATHD
ncbi:MAG: hypothetical protein K8H88_26310 [Sandaracinaceae bacterium]|nr:hypothetical protein [Sandaracinaceae bacterium]